MLFSCSSDSVLKKNPLTTVTEISASKGGVAVSYDSKMQIAIEPNQIATDGKLTIVGGQARRLGAVELSDVYWVHFDGTPVENFRATVRMDFSERDAAAVGESNVDIYSWVAYEKSVLTLEAAYDSVNELAEGETTHFSYFVLADKFTYLNCDCNTTAACESDCAFCDSDCFGTSAYPKCQDNNDCPLNTECRKTYCVSTCDFSSTCKSGKTCVSNDANTEGTCYLTCDATHVCTGTDCCFNGACLPEPLCPHPGPPGWTCDGQWYVDGHCDCDCGIDDLDCTPGECVPGTWTCEPTYYGDADCDCGCGATDIDCGNDQCPAGWTCRAALYGDSVCDCDCGGADIDCAPDACPPAGWTCAASVYNNGTCDCDCGAPDIDCAVNDCLVAPPEWVCGETLYGTNDGCDCGCGALDPDCTTAPGCITPSCYDAACAYCWDSAADPDPTCVP